MSSGGMGEKKYNGVSWLKRARNLRVQNLDLSSPWYDQCMSIKLEPLVGKENFIDWHQMVKEYMCKKDAVS